VDISENTQPSRQHPFRLLACAVAGMPVYISYLKDADASAYADGNRIYLPAGQSLEQQRLTIISQSLLIAGGSFKPSLMSGLLGRGNVKPRYLVLEIERCARCFGHRVPPYFQRAITPYQSNDNCAEAEDSLRIAKSNKPLPEPPSWYGRLYPMRILRNRGGQAGSPLDNESLQELEASLKQLRKQLDEDEDEDKIKDSFWQLLSSPKGKNGLLSNILKELLDMSSSPDGGKSESGSGTSVESVSGRWVKRLADVANALRSDSDISIPSSFVLQESGAHSYKEWDHSSQKYKPNWVSVEEVEAWTESDDKVIGDFSTGSNQEYQKMLAGLCFNVERHRNQSFGDDLVLDRLVDLTTNIRSGFSGDERVYSANLRTRRDLGVQILLDASSSTQEAAENNRNVCDVQMEAAWQLCQAFHDLGDRVAMHGFHSWGRSLVRLQRLKSFNEPMGAAVQHRCKELSVAGYTRCGAAIRHAVHLLNQYSGMPRNLLLVISDGYPYDDQYEGQYAAEDTKRALREARENHVACVCLSIGSDVANKKLEAIYGDANYLAVDTVNKVAAKLRPVIEAALSQTLSNH